MNTTALDNDDKLKTVVTETTEIFCEERFFLKSALHFDKLTHSCQIIFFSHAPHFLLF